jgi:cytidyltransferase-like protein
MQINKIVTLSELRNKILPENLKAGDSFVLCHGHYNLIHPGHMRFIEHAKSLGDKLVVAVYGDSYFSESEQKRMYPQFVRAQGVSALQLVDYALILDSLTLQEALGAIKPAVKHLMLLLRA